MKEYIEREAALRDWPLCDEPADAYQFIKNYPAADVQEVDKLTEAGKSLLKYCPELINQMLAHLIAVAEEGE